MKKTTLALLILFCFHFANAQWYSNGPYGGDWIPYLTATDSVIFAYSPGSLFSSRDSGENWSEVNSPLVNIWNDPLVAKGNIVIAGSYSGGLLISHDNGRNWSLQLSTVPDNRIYHVCISDKYIFAATGGYGTLYRAGLNGKDWVPLNTPFGSGWGVGVLNMAANGSEIYVDHSNGFFYTHDDGDTWINTGGNGWPAGDLRAMSFTDSAVFAGINREIYISKNKGGSWVKIAQFYSSSNINSMLARGSSIFAASSDGVFLSNDEGNSWTALTGLPAPIRSLQSFGGYIFAGSNANGLYRSADNANTWSRINNGLRNTRISAIAADNSAVYAGGGELFFSKDNGVSWGLGNNPSPQTTFSTLAINGNAVYAGTWNGLFRSYDQGNTWLPLNGGGLITAVRKIAFNGAEIYTAGDYGFSRSLDSGITWTGINSGFHLDVFTKPTSVVIAGSNVFASTGGLHKVKSVNSLYRSSDKGNTWVNVPIVLQGVNPPLHTLFYHNAFLFAGAGNGDLYRSNDDGASWVKANNGLPPDYILSLAESGSNLFAGTMHNGVYHSKDNGASWVQIFYTQYPVYQMAFNSTNIFIATDGDCVWSMSLAKVGVQDIPGSDMLKIYPNPGTGNITIESDENFNSVIVQNIIGETVYEGSVSNTKSMQLDLSTLPKGIYVLRFREADRQYSQKIIIQ